MSYETRAYVDGYGYPVVVMVVDGTHDISRLTHLLAGAPVTCEQLSVGQKLRRQLRRNNPGRAALKLLADHGGADFTGEADVAITHDVVMAFLNAPGDDQDDITGPLRAAFEAAGLKVAGDR